MRDSHNAARNLPPLVVGCWSLVDFPTSPPCSNRTTPHANPLLWSVVGGPSSLVVGRWSLVDFPTRLCARLDFDCCPSLRRGIDGIRDRLHQQRLLQRRARPGAGAHRPREILQYGDVVQTLGFVALPDRA